MKKSKNGFVVSAVLYPLLVLFLAIIMGLLSMTDTRKRILDKMKLEIEDSILDDATCSCETILAKLNFIIDKLDKGITATGGGASGSYTFNVLTLRIKAYETVEQLPTRDVAIGDIAMISDTPVTDYYIATIPPNNPKEGSVWVVQDHQSNYYVKSDYSRIGISYVMQYLNGSWYLKKSYVYDDNRWILLYYVNVKNHDVDLTQTNVNGVTEWKYGYTGEYQVFRSVFSGYYKFELWGAQGGTYGAGTGGLGAYTSGLIYLNAGETFYIYVGGKGGNPTGGWNGGRTAYNHSYASGGGGATDVRLVETTNKDAWNEFDSLKSRIMVAAGGGGGNYESYNARAAAGGAGGGILGMTGGGYAPGTGGTQSAPGSNYLYGGLEGTFTLGGTGSTQNSSYGFGSGGGGGYYGGGGSYANAGKPASGGGGSSYISGHVGVSSMNESSTDVENILHNGSALHYSGYYFKNTQMIDGTGHAWTQIRGSEQINQPNNGGTGLQTGQSGNGYAKISLQTIEFVSDEDLKDYADKTFREYHYTYAGSTPVIGYYQIFTAPEDGYYKAELWGSQGGSSEGGAGGLGAYTSGKIYLNKGKTVYVYVGIPGNTNQGGWNGGGTPYKSMVAGSGGGGATDIRLTVPSDATQWDEFDSLKSRIMVAAGGGGGNYESYNARAAAGGAGGGLIGYTGAYNYPGTGGTQSSPGYWYNNDSKSYGSYASFAKGGTGSSLNTSYSWGAGGGGGYYGGGGSLPNAGVPSTGGGGSSYISGHEGCSLFTEDSLMTNIIHTGSAYHYSGYYFINTKMIDGQGYTWSTMKNDQVFQPTWDGKSTQTGQSQGGHAKITLVEKVSKTNKEVEAIGIKNEHGWYYTYSETSKSVNAARYQEFKAPKNGYYKFELWGASSGNFNGTPGLGAYTAGEIYLNKGQIFYVYLGGTPDQYTKNIGGWNGGGNAFNGSASGGGGATDIRLTPTASLTYWDGYESLKSRIMVAAGGGGAGYDSYNGRTSVGGAGGGLNGYTGSGDLGGYGGTQSSPGHIIFYPTTAAGMGTLGKGGTSTVSLNSSYGFGGGGGGGLYGGGASTGNAGVPGGAGGGSSYISGHVGGSSLSENSTESNMIFTGSAYHYSGHYFINTLMIDGSGYNWNSQRNELVNQPVKQGIGTQTGNSGQGYARVTFLKDDDKTSSILQSEKLDAEKEWHYTYSGSTSTSGRYQTFIAPKNGYYSMALWGAQGGTYGSGVGGLGGYTYGEIYLSKGTTLYLYIGNRLNAGTASWNGGGSSWGSYAGCGGGSTDIRVTPNTYITVWNDIKSLASRIMVAGGGGGGDYESYNGRYANGGAGGGLTGYNGGNSTPGTGGTQIAAGYRTGYVNNNKGGVGFGGNGSTSNSSYGFSGGGGGGYYGGGGADANAGVPAGGGGGSSYISGHAGCIATTAAGLPVTQTYTTLADSVSYTNMKFTNTIMIDGTGKKWTTTVGSQLDYQPTYNGTSNQTGNSGVGHARIAYLGV